MTREQLDTLLTLRDNINVTVQTLIASKDLSGDTLPEIDSIDFMQIEAAEEITRELMHTADPSTNPAND